MSRLTWIKRDHGWRAGPYDIEFAAPELWVCTRRSRRGGVEIVMTSGSLSSLKQRVDKVELRRRRLRRSLSYLAVVAVSIVLITAVLIWDAPLAVLFVMAFSTGGLVAALRAVDCLVERSWETLKLTYQ